MIKILFSCLVLLAFTITAARADSDAALSTRKEDNTPALRELHARAKAGNADAQLNMGGIYFKGEPLGPDYAEAAKWFRLAANQGQVQAQFNLGMMYTNGQGVAQNYATAVSWYRLAALRSLAVAQLNLGVAYATGQGVPRNEAEAVKWFRLAAGQGEAQAQFNLGVMYANGQGVEQNLAESYRWASLAAARGHELAHALMRDLARRMTPEQRSLAMQSALPVPAASSPLKPEPAESTEAALIRCVNEWAMAWSGKRAHEYLDAYTPDFKPEGMSHEAWKKQRSERIGKPKAIDVSLHNMNLSIQDEGHASVSFTQMYHSDNYHDQQEKTLQMVKINNRWLIAAEHAVSVVKEGTPSP
ncbi:MAG: tetratricopeptide repeat protein [Proteobacteria bacterium]|nr:tetratricopeptide repeat protein [Pseudomonadota bacterium]